MSTLDTKQLNKSIRQIVRLLLGEPEGFVRPANQPAAAEKADESFATVQVLAITTDGIDRVKQANELAPSNNIAETIEGMRRVTVSVQFFRGDAYSQAARLQSLMRSSYAGDLLQSAGLGLIRANDAKDMTAVSSTSYESRAAIQIEFYLAVDEVLSVPTYGRFPVAFDTGKKKPDGTFYPPQQIEVTAP